MSLRSRQLMILFVLSLAGRAFGGMIPEKVQHLGLGTPLANVQKEFPDAKMTFQSDHNGLVFANLPPQEIWDSVLFEIKDDKVASLSLLRGVVKKDEENDRQTILREALKTYGRQFIKRIALTSEKRPEPVLIWKMKEITVYLSMETPLEQGSGDKNHLRLTIAPSTKDIGELFQMPTLAELEAASFNWLMADELKKADGR
jgi:hypothetical protein